MEGAAGEWWGAYGATNLPSALLVMLVRVKLVSGSKEGARGAGGGGRLFVGVDLCRVRGRARDPFLRGAPGAGTGRGRGGGREPRGPSRAAVGRPLLSRCVLLGGMRVFLTNAGPNRVRN